MIKLMPYVFPKLHSSSHKYERAYRYRFRLSLFLIVSSCSHQSPGLPSKCIKAREGLLNRSKDVSWLPTQYNSSKAVFWDTSRLVNSLSLVYICCSSSSHRAIREFTLSIFSHWISLPEYPKISSTLSIKTGCLSLKPLVTKPLRQKLLLPRATHIVMFPFTGYFRSYYGSKDNMKIPVILEGVT